MKSKSLVLIAFYALVIISCRKTENFWSVTSPDGMIEMHVTQNQIGQLLYYALMAGDTVLYPSKMGVEVDKQMFDKNLQFYGKKDSVIKETYTMQFGKRRENLNEANQIALQFTDNLNNKLTIECRAYNNGIAFRYVFPDVSDSIITINNELTTFNIKTPGKAWMLDYDTLATWSPAYEESYSNNIDIGTPSPKTTGWGFPLLFDKEDYWLLISESNLVYNYSGAHLKQHAPEGEYSIEYAHSWENYGLGSNKPASSLPWETPWRFITIGKNLGDIVESNLVHHLADPVAFADTAWINPGVSSWSWWGDHESGKNYEVLKKYVDLSAKMGWEYSLVDADWHIMEGGTLEDLARYAESVGVGLLIWYNSGGPHTQVMNAGPRDLMYNKEIRRKEMERISKMGIKGIKVDFFQSDKPHTINLYMDIARDAADFKLLLNTHGSNIPRGWHRTYPNYITTEAVRGAELYGWHMFPPDAVWLNTIYPFTRNVIGPMDYTPVTFTDYSEQSIRQTSHAHELALSILFESGIQHIAARAEGIYSTPDYVQDFLKNLPVAWDEIHFIDGYPGKDVILARRHGDKWYIAGINGERKEKTFQFNVGFLPENIKEINVIHDGENKRSFQKSTIKIPQDKIININTLDAGGFVCTTN